MSGLLGFTMVILLLLVLMVALPLSYGTNIRDNEENQHAYSPTDTVLISYSNTLCQGLQLSVPVPDFPVSSTLYLLDEKPELGKQDPFSFYRKSILTERGDYEYWKVFLYPGSTASYSACYLLETGGQNVVFYLVKGTNNYEYWQDNYNSFLYKDRITSSCSSGPNSSYTFTATAEDNYYFILELNNSNPSEVGINFDFNRILYDVNNGSIISSCGILLDERGSLCSVSLPLSSHPTALLEMQPYGEETDEWDSNIRVDVTCQPRAWVYAVITLSGVGFIVVLIAIALAVYMYCFRVAKTRPTTSTSPALPSQGAEEEGEDTPIVKEGDGISHYESYNPPPAYTPM